MPRRRPSPTDKAGSYRGRALKGYLRIARQFALPEAERAEMCRRALAATDDPADRKGVIEILVRYPHASTLAVAQRIARSMALLQRSSGR